MGDRTDGGHKKDLGQSEGTFRCYVRQTDPSEANFGHSWQVPCSRIQPEGMIQIRTGIHLHPRVYNIP